MCARRQCAARFACGCFGDPVAARFLLPLPLVLASGGGSAAVEDAGEGVVDVLRPSFLAFSLNCRQKVRPDDHSGSKENERAHVERYRLEALQWPLLLLICSDRRADQASNSQRWRVK